MKLPTYEKKKTFSKTTESQGGRPKPERLGFVIQKPDRSPTRRVKKPENKNRRTLARAEDRFPVHLKPMLTTLVDKPFDQEGWLYEVKWDGYRCIAFMHEGKVELRSRNDKRFNEKFYSVYDALKGLSLGAIVDGEIVVINDKGYRILEACRTGGVSQMES